MFLVNILGQISVLSNLSIFICTVQFRILGLVRYYYYYYNFFWKTLILLFGVDAFNWSKSDSKAFYIVNIVVNIDNNKCFNK